MVFGLMRQFNGLNACMNTGSLSSNASTGSMNITGRTPSTIEPRVAPELHYVWTKNYFFKYVWTSAQINNVSILEIGKTTTKPI